MKIILEVSINSWKTLSCYRKAVSKNKYIDYVGIFEQEQEGETYLPELCVDEEFFTNPLLWSKLKKILENKKSEIQKRALGCFNETDNKSIDLNQPHKASWYLKNILQREYEKKDMNILIETL